MEKITKKAYTFDDILLIPQRSSVLPKETDVSTDLTKADIRLNSGSTDPVTGKYWYQY